MSVYDINYNQLAEEQTPIDERQPIVLAWLRSLVKPLQYLRDLFFNSYADGSAAPDYNALTAYAKGDQVRHVDNAIYEALVPTTGNLPSDPLFWFKVQDVFIGIRERLKYNSRKIVLEAILNKWFRVAALPADQIYIENNDMYGTAFLLGETGPTSSSMPTLSANQQFFLGNTYTYDINAFTIYVPVAVFTGLDPDPTNAENIIRAIADKYVIAGMIYNVVTY
jgi:hypothetical protein